MQEQFRTRLWTDLVTRHLSSISFPGPSFYLFAFHLFLFFFRSTEPSRGMRGRWETKHFMGMALLIAVDAIKCKYSGKRYVIYVSVFLTTCSVNCSDRAQFGSYIATVIFDYLLLYSQHINVSFFSF